MSKGSISRFWITNIIIETKKIHELIYRFIHSSSLTALNLRTFKALKQPESMIRWIRSCISYFNLHSVITYSISPIATLGESLGTTTMPTLQSHKNGDFRAKPLKKLSVKHTELLTNHFSVAKKHFNKGFYLKQRRSTVKKWLLSALRVINNNTSFLLCTTLLQFLVRHWFRTSSIV